VATHCIVFYKYFAKHFHLNLAANINDESRHIKAEQQVILHDEKYVSGYHYACCEAFTKFV
jgi:hypothetical protein